MGTNMSKLITVHYDDKPIYNITIEKDYSKLASVIKEQVEAEHKVCVVSDSSVASHYLDAVMDIASECVSKVTSFVFPATDRICLYEMTERCTGIRESPDC